MKLSNFNPLTQNPVTPAGPEQHELTVTVTQSQPAPHPAAEHNTATQQPEHGSEHTHEPPRDVIAQRQSGGHGRQAWQEDQVKARLKTLRALAHSSGDKAAKIHKQMEELHGLLSKVLAEAAVNGEITAAEEQAAISGLEQLLLQTPAFQRTMQQVLETTKPLEEINHAESWGAWLQEKGQKMAGWTSHVVNPRVAGALAVGLMSMAAKNGAWYLPNLISANNIPFDSVSAMAKVFAGRWATANVAAGLAEYPLSVISQKIYKSTGHSMNELLAVMQLGDMLSAFALMKATGQEVKVHEGIGFASVAVAALVRTGMMSKGASWLSDSMGNWLHGKQAAQEATEITPISLPAAEAPPADAGAEEGGDAASAGAAQQAAHTGADHDLETGRPAMSQSQARSSAKVTSQLFRDIPQESWKLRMNELNSLLGDLSQIEDLLAAEQPEPPASPQDAAGADGQPMVAHAAAAEPASALTTGAAATPAPATSASAASTTAPTASAEHDSVTSAASGNSESTAPSPMAAMIAEVSALLNSDQVTQFTANLRDNLGANSTGDAEALNNLDAVRGHLDDIHKDLVKNGGRDPKAMGFAIGMLTMYLAPLLLGNTGQLSGNAGLSNINTRGILNIAGSMSAQTGANLMHLSMEDNPNDSKAMQRMKSIGLSIGLTPSEFVPLVLGLLFVDKAQEMAGKDGQWPQPGTIRNFQELGRTFYSTLFTNLVLGTPVSKNDIMAGIVQLGGMGLTAGMGLKQEADRQN